MKTSQHKPSGVAEQADGAAHTEDGAALPPPLQRPRATPLPRKQMIVLTLVLMTESVCGSMLLPFVPRFIAFLKHITVEEAGYYSGILVGLFMLGQVVSSKLWGYLSDAYGRKLPLTTGLLAGGLAMFFFGYTKSFIVCCLLRFMHGFFNGNVLVAKTVIADITDKTNEAQGFALVSLTWGVGTLFGPFIGGFLYNPTAKSYLSWLAGGSLHAFFATYPAFLPSVVIFLYTMVAICFCVFLLKETNVHRKHFKDTVLGRWWAARRGRADSAAASATDIVVVAADGDKAKGVPVTAAAEVSSSMNEREGVADGKTSATAVSVRRKLSYAQAMRIGALRNITIFYMLVSASDMTYGEILPLWGNADNSVGGMGLTENKVAMLMLSYSIPAILANLYFHHVCHFFHDDFIVFWRYSLSMYTIATLVIPAGSIMGGGGYYYVMLLGMTRQVGMSWCYSLVHMLTAKAAPLGCVGSVYGISQSMAAATRCVVPFLVAPLFAWSLRKGHIFPFNYYLVFLIAGVPAAACVAMSFYVQVTRNEECELDFAAESAMDAAVDEDDADDAYHAPGSQERQRGRSGLADGEAADSDNGGSAYMSLVNSFCVNPLHDTYVNMQELEQANAEAVQEMHRQHAGGGLRGVHAGEDRRFMAARDEDLLPHSHHV